MERLVKILDIESLFKGLKESLQFYHFTLFDKRKININNPLKRLKKTISRKKIVRIFSNKDLYIWRESNYVLENIED